MFDGAKLIATEKRATLSQELLNFESEKGWRVRVYTNNGPEERPKDVPVRAAWRPDDKTVVIDFDPTSPNIISYYYIGQSALQQLHRPFWIELQSRFGNLYYIREEGEQAAVLNSVGAVVECLGRSGGCYVVPGLPSEQYGFTLLTSVAGGLICGSALLIEPQGFVQRQWIWAVLFFPLWGSLFLSFGLGPIVSRTNDRTPLIANTASFLVAAALPKLGKVLMAPPPRQQD